MRDQGAREEGDVIGTAIPGLEGVDGREIGEPLRIGELAIASVPVHVPKIGIGEAVGDHLQLAGIDVGDYAGSFAGTIGQIVDKEIAGDLPRPPGSIRGHIAGESWIVEIRDARAPTGVGIIHLYRPEAWVAAQQEGLARCPNQAPPE